MKGYIALAIAIIGEVFGSTMLKFSEGFTNILPSIGFVAGFGIAFYSISICVRTVSLGTAYAIWSGAGTVLTALIGVLLWKEPFTLVTLIGILLIVGGVFILNSAKNAKQGSEGTVSYSTNGHNR
ncbi:DMT family transporter [Candidatus Pristimantibacillus sp. PTI5]|uniref:DMT family transporter n=1 Tax=Candidatus Pristimantibacillus sp. PTI5 TaxID=3400422 RepID=UPI003B0249F7